MKTDRILCRKIATINTSHYFDMIFYFIWLPAIREQTFLLPVPGLLRSTLQFYKKSTR